MRVDFPCVGFSGTNRALPANNSKSPFAANAVNGNIIPSATYIATMTPFLMAPS